MTRSLCSSISAWFWLVTHCLKARWFRPRFARRVRDGLGCELFEVVQGAFVGPEGVGVLLVDAQGCVPGDIPSVLTGDEQVRELTRSGSCLLLETLAFDAVEVFAVGGRRGQPRA